MVWVIIVVSFGAWCTIVLEKAVEPLALATHYLSGSRTHFSFGTAELRLCLDKLGWVRDSTFDSTSDHSGCQTEHLRRRIRGSPCGGHV
jgi:hypothetical protein